MTDATFQAPGTAGEAAAKIPPRLSDDPVRIIRIGAGVAGLFFVGFLGWAALAPLDAGAYAHGVVAVAGNRQAVQSREGGVVTAIRVVEGQSVVKGQILVELSASELRASERGMAASSRSSVSLGLIAAPFRVAPPPRVAA